MIFYCTRINIIKINVALNKWFILSNVFKFNKKKLHNILYIILLDYVLYYYTMDTVISINLYLNNLKPVTKKKFILHFLSYPFASSFLQANTTHTYIIHNKTHIMSLNILYFHITLWMMINKFILFLYPQEIARLQNV